MICFLWSKGVQALIRQRGIPEKYWTPFWAKVSFSTCSNHLHLNLTDALRYAGHLKLKNCNLPAFISSIHSLIFFGGISCFPFSAPNVFIVGNLMNIISFFNFRNSATCREITFGVRYVFDVAVKGLEEGWREGLSRVATQNLLFLSFVLTAYQFHLRNLFFEFNIVHFLFIIKKRTIF